MPNTSKLLSKWFDFGKEDGYAYMAVILDAEDDYNDYPAFYWTKEECKKDIDDFDVAYTCGHERLMEVYDLNAPKQPQMDALRHFALLPKDLQHA